MPKAGGISNWMVMALAAFQEIERHANSLLSTVGGMDFADRESVRKQVEDCLRTVLTLLGQGENVSPADSAAVSSARDAIAECRQYVHQCLPRLEQLRSEWADRYRKELGDGKNEYEKLSHQMQQMKSPEAYRWKRNFEQLIEIVARLGQLNGRLMDLSSQVEREHDKKVPPPEDTVHLDRQDRDPEMPANMS